MRNPSNRQHQPYPLPLAAGTRTYVLPPLGGMPAGQWYNFVHPFAALLQAGQGYDTEDATNWQVTAYTPVGTHQGTPNSYIVTLQPVPWQQGMCSVQIQVSPCPQSGVIATWA